MPRRAWRGRSSLIAALAAIALATVAEALMPPSWRETLRENALDGVLRLDATLRPSRDDRAQPPIVVVDIDDQTLDRFGSWPLPRSLVARLAAAIAAAKPRVIVFDILFANADVRSPAALARELGAVADRPDVAALADRLPDGDRLLAGVMTQAPVVLGFVLDPQHDERVSGTPVLVRGSPPSAGFWHARGAIGPLPDLANAAAGLGALPLPGDADGMVRRVPVFVEVGGELRAGLALEALRAAQASSTYLVQSEPPLLRVGDVVLPLPSDGLLRLVPASPNAHADRTLRAADLIDGKADLAKLAGAIVLVGSSAPEVGGLRQTTIDPLMPSVQIQADAVAQMALARVPLAITGAPETALVFATGLAALAAALLLTPIGGAVLTLALVGAMWGGSTLLSIVFDRLLDPLTPSLAAASVFAVASVASYAAARRREARIRRRFEQHLAPAVVRRIVDEPGLLKLGGERRELTALFTDIEDFTAMTHAADPARLVEMLDEYVEGVARIVIAHGGMVDKVVGDAVCALFNVPLDLDRHAARAVACAVAIRDWTAAHRLRPGAAALGLGRTRIGVETGEAIVGDVGLHTKLDYTAYGDVINAAARLEAANKELGSSICIGPVTASRLDAATLRPLGKIALRGRDAPLAVCEPWPTDMGLDLRARYLAAVGLIKAAPGQAAASFDKLAEDCSNDPVPAAMARRLRAETAVIS